MKNIIPNNSVLQLVDYHEAQQQHSQLELEGGTQDDEIEARETDPEVVPPSEIINTATNPPNIVTFFEPRHHDFESENY